MFMRKKPRSPLGAKTRRPGKTFFATLFVLLCPLLLPGMTTVSSAATSPAPSGTERICEAEQLSRLVGKVVNVGERLPRSRVFVKADGATKRISTLSETPLTLYVFWDSTCSYCLDEIRALPMLRERFGADLLTIVSVASWYEEKDLKAQLKEAEWEDVAAGLGTTVECLDADGSAAYDFRVKTIPYMIVADADNTCLTWTAGPVAPEDLVRIVEKFLPR